MTRRFSTGDRGRGLSQSGQAVAEAAFCMPLLLLILWGVCYFGKAYMYAHNLEAAAYYSALWQAGGQNITSVQWKQRVQQHFALPAELTITREARADYTEHTEFEDYLDGQAVELDLESDMSGARVTLTYDPIYLDFLPPVNISAAAYVDTRTWTRDEIHGHQAIQSWETSLLECGDDVIGDLYYPYP